MERFSFALFAASCTVIAALLLLDVSGLTALEPIPRKALEVASAGMMVGFAAWAVRML
jgi:hypothetical protein